jgi:phenylacetate-CoA ligase
LAWPAVLTGEGAALMALQQQFGESQWWAPEKLRAAQFRQLGLLVAHAAATVPFYAERLRAVGITPDLPLTEELWARIPVLTRRDVRDLGAQLHAQQTPPTHGGLFVATTGGSTGVPVSVRKTELAHAMWGAVQVRDELWHREDAGGTILRIRATPDTLTAEQQAAARSPQGLVLPSWGAPHSAIWRTGKLGLIDFRQPTAVQAEMMLRLQPDYLYTAPSHVRLLMAHFREKGLRLSSLKAVWTMGECVTPELRAGVREIFGCRIVDAYSSEEAGYVALQCPEHPHYHVQSETILVEVLDPTGRQCQPGEAGQVVVTPLHNFAQPLLRYAIGDDAEVGEACACGRGLPVLRRVLGRTMDLVSLPDGGRRRVSLDNPGLAKQPALREYQLVQRSLERIEVMLVASRALTEVERGEILAAMGTEFGPDFQIDLSFHESLPRTGAGKLRPFVSDLPQTD